MDNTEFVNAYINKLVTEVGEAAKARVLLSTQLEFTSKQLETLLQITQELKAENEELKKTIEQQSLTPEPVIDNSTDRFVTSEVKYKKKKKDGEDF